jgi:hypothetical protein
MAGGFSGGFSPGFNVGAGGAAVAWWGHRGQALGAEMFLQRNVASQVFTVPGTLRAAADGSAVTSGASLTWVKDGAGGASAGTLTHVSDGAYTYQPTQGETDAKICGWVLSKTGAVGLAGSLRTTNGDPNDGTRLGLTALPNVAAGAGGGLPVIGTGSNNFKSDASANVTVPDTQKVDVNTVKTQAVTCAAGVTFNVNVGTTQPVNFTGAGASALAKVNVQDTAVDSAGTVTGTVGGVSGVTFPATVASSTEVTSIQNNTRCVRVVPDVIERPDSGTTTYRIELLLYDEVGNMEAPDSAPTLALVNQSGTDLSSRLASTTGTLVSTGRYRWTYTASVSDALEQLVWAFSVVEGGATRVYGNGSVIVDTTAVDFTSSDRTTLNALAAGVNVASAAGAALTSTGGANFAALVNNGGVVSNLQLADLAAAAANMDAAVSDVPAAVWANTTRTLSAFSFTVTANPVALTAAGLDAVLVESGIAASAALVNDAGTQLTSINARQALAAILSSVAAVLSGGATTAIAIKPAGKPAAADRIDATVTADGDRTAVNLRVPT